MGFAYTLNATLQINKAYFMGGNQTNNLRLKHARTHAKSYIRIILQNSHAVKDAPNFILFSELGCS